MPRSQTLLRRYPLFFKNVSRDEAWENPYGMTGVSLAGGQFLCAPLDPLPKCACGANSFISFPKQQSVAGARAHIASHTRKSAHGHAPPMTCRAQCMPRRPLLDTQPRQPRIWRKVSLFFMACMPALYPSMSLQRSTHCCNDLCHV